MSLIDRGNPTPLYEQLKLILSDQILNGVYRPGDQLPTERDLCRIYCVSRITAVRALNELAQTGLIRRIQGKGSIVAPHPIDGNLCFVEGFSDTMRRQGVIAESRILSVDEVTVDLATLADFDLPYGDKHRFVRFDRLRFVNHIPAVLLKTTVRQELAEKMLRRPLENVSFYKLYQEILGSQVIRNEASIRAVAASPEVVDKLIVEPNSPQLLYRAVSYIEGEIPVEVATGIFRGDLFRFTATMHLMVAEIPSNRLQEIAIG